MIACDTSTFGLDDCYQMLCVLVLVHTWTMLLLTDYFWFVYADRWCFYGVEHDPAVYIIPVGCPEEQQTIWRSSTDQITGDEPSACSSGKTSYLRYLNNYRLSSFLSVLYYKVILICKLWSNVIYFTNCQTLSKPNASPIIWSYWTICIITFHWKYSVSTVHIFYFW